jgi:hypothetical protein
MDTREKALRIGTGIVRTIRLLASLWLFWYGYCGWQTGKAKLFCESLIPQIEAARERDGNYPATADPKWIEGKKVPFFVNANDYYQSTAPGVYRLYFPEHGDFWDDEWSRECGIAKHDCNWLSYDKNRKR